MNRLNAKHRLYAIVDNQIKDESSLLQNLIVKYYDKNLYDKSSTELSLFRHRPMISLAVPSSFFDKAVNTVDEYDFVETVVSFYHESYHAMQLIKNPRSDDAVDQLVAYTSRLYNNETYKNEYHKFSYEIAAERYALMRTYESLGDLMTNTGLESILLDYVNAKATGKSSDYRYFISTDTRFTNMNDVFKAFDEAYVKSYIDKKDFSSITDCVGKVLSEDNELCDQFNKLPDGKEQTRFAASIVLEQHPELYHQQKNLETIATYVNDVRNEHQSGHDVFLIDDFDIRL